MAKPDDHLRDLFAMAALIGFMRPGDAERFQPVLASRAYDYADAMMAARTPNPQQEGR